MALQDNALTDLATLKTELGITGSSEDSYLERTINVVSQMIASYCGRVFQYETGITEKQSGYGTPYMILKRAPVASITSVTYDGATVDSANYEIQDANAGILYKEGCWIWTTMQAPNIAQDPFPGNERKLYEVTYTAGWITPEQENQAVGTRDLPYDIEDACIALSTARYNQRGSNALTGNVKSERLMEYSVSYQTASSSAASATGIDEWMALYPGIAAILGKYKRIAYAQDGR